MNTSPIAMTLATEQYIATLVQAIGRLRPSKPELADKPIPVMLLIGEPPSGIDVQIITTLPDWLKTHDPEWLAMNPVRLGRVGCTNMHGVKNLVKANTEREGDANARFTEAHQSLIDGGCIAADELPSQTRLCKRVNALFGKTPSSITAKKYLASLNDQGVRATVL